MRTTLLLSLLLLAACSSDSPSDADASEDAGGSSSGSTSACRLLDDTGGPGQYTDSCVQRSFIVDHAGTYVSPTCTLTIDVSGSVPARFSVTVTGATLAGTHENDWEGGAAGAGNDSYYRFTTDATFATTKTLSFNAGRAFEGGESNLSLRVEGIDTSTVTYTGRYSELRGADNMEVDCGPYTKQ